MLKILFIKTSVQRYLISQSGKILMFSNMMDVLAVTVIFVEDLIVQRMILSGNGYFC